MKLELKLTSEGIEDSEKMEAILRAEDLLFALKAVVKKVHAFEKNENCIVGIEGVLKSMEVWHLVNE